MPGTKEELAQLLKSRAGYAGAFTVKRKLIEDLLKSKATSVDISAGLTNLRQALDKLHSCNNDCFTVANEICDETVTEDEVRTYVAKYDEQYKNVFQAVQIHDQQHSVNPGDSVSQHGSSVSQHGSTHSSKLSSASGAKMRAEAKKASLMAKAKMLEKQQAIQLDKLRL